MKKFQLNRQIFFILALVFLIQIVFNKCLALDFQGKTSQRQKTKTVNIGIVGPKKQLDPVLGYNLFDFLVIQCIYQTVVRLNSDGSITADLAEKWEISKDGKKYTFHINPKSRFSDGTPVTGKDVAISLSRHLWPNSKSIIKGYLLDVLRDGSMLGMNGISPAIKVISPLVFEVHLNKPYPPFLHVLAMPGFSITSVDEISRSRNIGSGHFVAKFDDDSNSWVLKQNPFYPGKKANISEIRISSLKDATEAFHSVSERDVDVVLGLMSETGSHLNSQIPRDYQVYSTNSLSFAHLIFNMKKQEFKSQKLREALGSYLNELAKNTSSTSSNFHYQKTIIPKGVLPAGYYERIVKNTSIEEVNSLIKNNLGRRPYKIILSEGRLPKDFVNRLRSALDKISGNFIVEELSVGEYRKQRDSGNYDLAYLGYIGNFADPDGFLDCIRENNFPGVSVGSDELFQSIKDFKFSQSTSERLKGYVRAIKIFEDKWSVIPLYQTNVPIIHHKDILIPDTHYRYESEIWSFLWKTE